MRTSIVALLLAVISGRSGYAADADDTCKRAKEALGSQIERGMSPEQCQQALDAAEEERWQLWLDIAAADELAGDDERAALSLYRFLTAADRRARPLPPQWVVMRDGARVTVARMDQKILETKGRVTITSNPPGAELLVTSRNAPALVEKVPATPLTAYFAPGSHTVRLRVVATDVSREVSFTVAAGAVVQLNVDLRPEAPREVGVTEAPGTPVLGQLSPGEGPPSPMPDPVTVIDENAPPDDPDGPPMRAPKSTLTDTLGTASIAVGGAAIAMGVTFALIASGLDDEAACSGAACDVDAGLRAHVRRDADVAWNRAAGTLVAGTLLVAGGIVVLVLTGDDDGPAALAPWFGPDGAGLSGRATF